MPKTTQSMYSTGNIRIDSPQQLLFSQEKEAPPKLKTVKRKLGGKQPTKMKIVRSDNIMVLQKIFDKVFIHKKEIGT